MPRKNKRKVDTTGKDAVCFSGTDENDGGKPECFGCAFVSYSYVCMTSDGT